MLLNKKFMLIAIFLVSLLAISAVSASDNSTSDIVCADDNIVDDVLSDSDDGTFSALKNKIDAAGEGSTISLENDYAYEGDSDNPISISKQLTIDGKGHTIDGNSKTSVFRLNAGVTLKNIIFTHCMGRYGGTISISASDCNIDSCNFIDCNGLSEYGFPKKDNWGAGIYNLGANCNIDSCNFVNCTTYNGGAIYTSALNSKITSCSFTNCHVGNQGGAISNDLECTIASCNFTQCSADFQGEAIFNALESGYSNVCNINECNFINCTSEYNTKTIFNNKGNAKATKCRFIDIDKSDATKDVTLVDCIFKKAGEPDPVPVVLTDDDFNFTFITNEVKDNDDAAIISLFIPNGVDESNGVIRVKYGEGAYDYENFNIGSNNVNKLLTIYFDDLYIYNPEGSYNLNIAYYVGDDFKLELGNGTLNVIKTYSADDFISSFYDRVVDEADEDVGYVRDSTGSNLDGVVTVFANNTQVYRKEFNGTVLGQSIDCGDLIGSFNGVYNMKITYNKSGIEYSKEATFNFVISVVNKELTPEDFKVTFLASEVDLENSNQAIISYYCPEGMKGYSPQIIVRYGNGSFDRQIYDIKSNEINTYKNITWSSLYQWDTGVYNLSVWYGDYFEPILKLGEISIKVVDNYVPVDEDFMELYPKVISDPEDYVCVMCDPTETGLNGVVTIYANGTQVYSQKLIRAQNSGIQIRAKNLTGNLNGEYKIKVVYNKADGKQYSLEEMITFRNIINADPVKTTISASALSMAYGANKNLVATLKDAQGKPIEGVDVIINIMGVKYPLKTDKNGQIKQSVSSLPPKTHTITLTFNGNANYAKSTKSVKVTVKKATPTITAAKKTYKVSEKTKKYTITLKVNGKVMKSTKVSLTVNKKTFSANTNSKGQATFKINNLKKKGTFSATINFKATSYYNKATKTVKITAK